MRTEALNLVEPHITNQLERERLQSGFGVFLFGKEIAAYTKSPIMWNAVFKQYDMGAYYHALDIPTEGDVETILSILASADQFAGTMVGAPYKGTVLDALKKIGRVDSFADKVGAVNTVVNENGVLIGYNTDARGEIENLRSVITDFSGLSVIVLGAGGGAQGVIAALLEEGVQDVVVANRTPKNAEALRDRLNSHYGNKVRIISEREAPKLIESGTFGLILNASMKGQATKETADYSAIGETTSLVENLKVSQNTLKKLAGNNPNAVCADLIYNPPETPFLRQAREAGLITNNGMMMLVHQAAIALHLMFPDSRTIPYNEIAGTMREAFESSLKNS